MGYIIGLIYLIGLLTLLVYGSLGIRHAKRFTYLSDKVALITLLYAGLSIVLVIISAIAFFSIDWR